MLHKSFKPAKCKTSLKLAVSRSKLLKNKKEVLVKQLRRDLAQLLESGQDQTARIRVEHVVREEKMMAVYELIEIYCELIAIRLPIIESQKTCPIDLKEAVSSVIFASPRCSDIPELVDVRRHFTAKYGKEFVSAAVELRPDCGVNRTLVEKLSAKAPDGPTKLKILTAIAEEHNIKWEPKAFGEKEQDLLSGPSTFENASKMHVEPSNVQSTYYDRASNNVHMRPENEVKQEAPINYQGNNVRSSFGSQNMTPTEFNAAAAPNPNLKPSGNGMDRMESSNTYSEDQNPRQNWNMEFKDAVSAAQAAAESAERASMAARAAAELSSRGNIVSQYSTGSQSSTVHAVQDEMPKRRSGSSFNGEAFVRGHMSNNFKDKSSRPQYEEIGAKEQHNFTGHTERLYGDGNKSNSRSSQLPTAAFTSGSAKNNYPSSGLPVNRMSDESSQSYGGWNHQAQTSVDEDDEDDVDVDLATLTERLRGGSHQSETVSHSSASKKTIGDFVSDESSSYARRNSQSIPHSEDVVTVDEFIMRRQPQRTHDGLGTEKASDLEGERFTEHSAIADSCSHSSPSSSFSDRRDDVEPNRQKYAVVGNPFAIVDEEKYHDEAKTTNDSGSVFFDDYGSDGENPIFDLDKGPETRSDIFSPHRKSTSYLSENINAPSLRTYRVDLFANNISEPHSSGDQRSASVFSEGLDDSDVRVHGDELPPAIFDDARGPHSESEEELQKFESDPEDTFSAGPKKSEFDLIRKGSDKFEDADAEKEDQSRHSKGSSAHEADDDNWSPRKSAVVGDSDILGLGSDTATELRFGKLTGGLRNKGFRHPPYVRSSSGAASSPKQAAVGETKKYPVSNPPETWSNSEIADDSYDQEVSSEIQKQSSTTGAYRKSSRGEASTARKSLEDTAEKFWFSSASRSELIDADIGDLDARDKDEYEILSGRLEEKSMRSSSGETRLSKQAVVDSSTKFGFSSPPQQISGSRLEPNNRVIRSATGEGSSSILSYGSEQSEDKEEVMAPVLGSKTRYGAGLSRRTKGSPSKTDRSSLLKPSSAPSEEETQEPLRFSSRSSYNDRRSEVQPTYTPDDGETQERTADRKSSLRSSYVTEAYRTNRLERAVLDDRAGSEPLELGKEAMEEETREPAKFPSRSSYTDRRSEVKSTYLFEEGKTPERTADRKSSSRSSYGNDTYGSIRPERAALDNKASSERLQSGKEAMMEEVTREPTKPSSRSSYTDRRSGVKSAYPSEEGETPERGAHRKSSSRSSYGREAYRSTQPERAASDDKGSFGRLQLRKEALEKPKSETPKSEKPSGSPQMSGSSGPSESSKAARPSLVDTSRENSFNRASHVHPKLPDYDTIAAQLELLRANRK